MASNWNRRLPVTQASEMLRLNENDVQWLIDSGLLETISIGGRDYVQMNELTELDGSVS